MIAALVCLASLQGMLPDRDSTAVATIRANVPDMQKQYGVPGVVVTVVRNGRVVLNEGFGLANREDAIPVDAEHTVFRTASVSKTFTALAIMRLARLRNLDVQADVRRLVPELRTRNPVSIHQLLTHTSGIEDRDLGYLNPPGVHPAGLAAVVSSLPLPKRQPADIPGYSNYGYAVAGLAAERVNGVPFSDYVRDSVLAPLGMHNTSFILTPGPDTPPGLAMEYRSDGTRRIQRSSKPYPAGNIGTTGADMARLLSALDHPDVSALFQSTRAQLSTLTIAVVVVLIVALATLVRWRRTRPRDRAIRLLPVLILAATFVAVVLTAGQVDELVVGPTPALYACLALTSLAAIVSVVNATIGVRTLVSSDTLVAHAANGVWTLACLGLFWFFFTNNLIGFRL